MSSKHPTAYDDYLIVRSTAHFCFTMCCMPAMLASYAMLLGYGQMQKQGLQRGRVVSDSVWNTCEKVWHVWIQALHHILGGIQREDSVVIAVEQPLEGVPQMPVMSQLTLLAFL